MKIEDARQILAQLEIQGVALSYLQALSRYLAGRREETLLEGCEIGRRALAAGFDLQQMAEIHLSAVNALDCFARQNDHEQNPSRAETASAFFASSILPFEINRRDEAETGVLARLQNRALNEQIRSIRHLIYDNTLQLIAAIHLAIGRMSRTGPVSAAEAVSSLTTTLDRVEFELRSVSAELCPGEGVGLKARSGQERNRAAD
jgi:hypothetical protein